MKILKVFSRGLLFFIALISISEAKDFPLVINQKLQTEVEALIKEMNVPGVNVGIWIPDQGDWVHSFGKANITTEEKLNLNHHFRIGGITKTFIVTAILQLVDKGDLSLEDKISKYIDNVPEGDNITIRQLANMTSGLANYSENEECIHNVIYAKNSHTLAPSELLAIAFKMPMTFKPGQGWKYSNTNAILLGLVIEKVSSMSLDKYLEKNIFKPLGLKNTSFPIDEKMPVPYAHGYTNQTIDSTEEDCTSKNPSWTFAAGQIISTFDDLKIWAKALGTGALLSKESFHDRLTWLEIAPNTKKRKYGLGIGFNNGWINHAGELPGYNVTIAYLPEKQATFVSMVNTDVDPKINGKAVPAAHAIFEVIAKILTPKNVPMK